MYASGKTSLPITKKEGALLPAMNPPTHFHQLTQQPAIIVRKYGGSSVSAAPQMMAIAKELAELHRQGHPLVVVISAMGKTTDQLVQLSREITQNPALRELDMLLTAGERISMALLAMALIAQKCPAMSFTGSQAGILTTSAHSDARIHDLRPTRVEQALRDGKVVVLAGFQGVCPESKEVTTLGRGGSDTTAVALAGYFRAPRCEILKDVDGIYSADPNIVDSPIRLNHLPYDVVLAMTFWGAKVLHYRSVALAKHLNVPLYVGLAHGERSGTLIQGESNMYEQNGVTAITSHREVLVLRISASELSDAQRIFDEFLQTHELPYPLVLDYQRVESAFVFYISAASENLRALRDCVPQQTQVICEPTVYSTISLVGGDLSDPQLPKQVIATLHSQQIAIQKMRVDSGSLTLFVLPSVREDCIRTLHQEFIK